MESSKLSSELIRPKQIEKLIDEAYGNSFSQKCRNAWPDIIKLFPIIDEITTLNEFIEKGFSAFTKPKIKEKQIPIPIKNITEQVSRNWKEVLPKEGTRTTTPSKTPEYWHQVCRKISFHTTSPEERARLKAEANEAAYPNP